MFLSWLRHSCFMSSHFILGIFDWQFCCCNKFAYLARFSMGLHNRHHVYTHHKRIAARCSGEMGWETERYGMETKWNGGLSSSHGRVVNATRRGDLLFYCGAQFVTHNSATVCMFVCVWRVCVALGTTLMQIMRTFVKKLSAKRMRQASCATN